LEGSEKDRKAEEGKNKKKGSQIFTSAGFIPNPPRKVNIFIRK
jgi:hypothetical protein